MYELAAEDEQRYKEAKVILEKALVREKDGLQEMRYVEWLHEWMCTQSEPKLFRPIFFLYKIFDTLI